MRKALLSLVCGRSPHGPSHDMPALFVDVFFGTSGIKTVSSRNNPVSKHKGFNVTFGNTGSIISVARRLKPRYFISEQALGFATPYQKSDPAASPKNDFVTEVMSLTRDDGSLIFSKCLYFKLDSTTFLETGRPRLNSTYCLVGIRMNMFSRITVFLLQHCFSPCRLAFAYVSAV